ncbi:ADAMTS-like protein 2, partial [Ophiophagus hannah]
LLIAYSQNVFEKNCQPILDGEDSSEAAEEAGTWNEEVTKWWGEWSSWSTCSRTCGGGVMSRERHCLWQRLHVSQGTNSSMCLGQSKRYHLCQQQLCPANTASFKQHQCASFNAKAFGKHYYHWMPLYPDDYTSISNKPCDLQCTSRNGERQLMTQAQDGTSCKDRAYQGVCISGKCEPIGCDGSLYSSQVMDRCRVCGGDGSTCYRVSGSFRKGISQLGYVFITNIPAGATDILIIERRKTENILALADDLGHFFFNGNSAIDNPQNFRVAGTVFKYRRPSNLHSDGLEYIIAQGPTNQSLNVMGDKSLFNCRKLNNIMISTATPHGAASFELHEANRIGPSRQHLFRSLCLQDPQNAAFCRALHYMTAKVGRKNSTVRLWGHATIKWPEGLPKQPAKKNFPDKVNVDPFVMNEATNDTLMAISSNPSSSSRLPISFGNKQLSEPLQRPGAESNDFELSPLGREDISLADMYRWKVSAYAPCSSTCTSGISTSYAMCVRYDGVEVEETYCDALTRPEPTHEFCAGRECQPRWETSQWSECSRTCGEGYQYRIVRCWKMLAPGFDSSVYDDMCESAGLTRPMERKSCKNKVCGPQWELSEWSECSARCGSQGTMRREVRCSVEPKLCNQSTKPVNEKECLGPPCDRHWAASDWGPCSGLCGEGRMNRLVTCRNVEGKLISESQCNPNTKPLAIYPCGDKNCPAHWVEQEWDHCNATCGRGVKMRTVLCVGLENGLYKEYPERRCEAFRKPETQAPCFQRPCSTWFSTSWSQCSKTCGTGLRFREVKCYQGETLGQGCESTSKPEARQTCQLQPCPTDAPDEDCDDKATANCVLVLKKGLLQVLYGQNTVIQPLLLPLQNKKHQERNLREACLLDQEVSDADGQPRTSVHLLECCCKNDSDYSPFHEEACSYILRG